MRSPGVKPPAGVPSTRWRVRAACRPRPGPGPRPGRPSRRPAEAPAVEQAAPGVGALDARAPAPLGDLDVRDAVRGLQARPHAQPGEARPVGRVQQLHVLDPRRQRELRHRPRGRLDGVERRAHGAVPDGVDRDREPAGGRLRHRARQFRRRHQVHAGLRAALVGLEQGRGARAQRAVGEQLHRRRSGSGRPPRRSRAPAPARPRGPPCGRWATHAQARPGRGRA